MRLPGFCVPYVAYQLRVQDELLLVGILHIIDAQAEIIRVVSRTVEGLSTTDDSLAVEAIGRVGPGGNFLADEHTLRDFRRELFEPGLLDYRNFDAWQSAGSTSLLERARARVGELLASSKTPPLADQRRRQVLEILNG